MSDTRAKRAFDLVHSDVKSFPIASYRKYRYFVSFLDDYSSYCWIVLLKTKDEVLLRFKQFVSWVERQYSSKIKAVKSDFGGEYKSLKFDKYVKDLGIEVQASAPRTPQQNGRAERLNRTIMDKAEAMRHYASIPPSWWEFAVSHAVYVYNRTPVRRLKWQTPYKLLTGVTPDVSNLRVFGCLSWVWIHPDNRKNKLSAKAAPMIFLGYPKGVKGYQFMRIGDNSPYVGTKAVFDERLFPKVAGFKTAEAHTGSPS
jgi:transposase InsO family protein